MLLIVGAIFFCAGWGMFWGLFIYPLTKSREARNWPVHPCHIELSEVEEHHDDDGSSYSPKIRYTYALDGKDFVSERYTFTSMSSGRRWAEKIVERFPAGRDSVCYYDPNDPAMSVLERGFRGMEFWFGLLFPWVFILVGGGILYFGLIKSRAQPRSGAISPLPARAPVANPALTARPLPFAASDADQEEEDGEDGDEDEERELDTDPNAEYAEFEGPRKLKQTASRLATVLVVGLVGLFWNGIVGLFLYLMVFRGQGNWFLLLFLSPFVVVGLLMILAFFHQLLSLVNPTVEMALSNGAVALGESIDVAWQLTGRVQRIRHLSVVVEGTERATYTRGTSTVTDTHRFRAIELLSTEDPGEFAFGTRVLTIPADTMHSFASGNNAIVWTIKVVGDIPWWPNVNDTFEFKVKPAIANTTDEN